MRLESRKTADKEVWAKGGLVVSVSVFVVFGVVDDAVDGLAERGDVGKFAAIVANDVCDMLVLFGNCCFNVFLASLILHFFVVFMRRISLCCWYFGHDWKEAA